MIRASRNCSRTDRIAGSLLFLCVAVAAPLHGQSAGCNRARAIVEEVRAFYDTGTSDHRSVLEKLRTAQQLCPTLGDAWKYAHCSAVALGDQQKARMYRDRAVFNGVTEFDCLPTETANAAPRSSLPSYVRQKYALVVGIGQFKDPAIPRLQYAAKDATDFAALLTDPKYGNFDSANVTLLTDQSATRAAILNAMQQLFLQARDEDLVVTYISSHGSPAQQELGLGGIGHIVTYDTSAKNIWVDAIEYQDLAKKTALIKARRKVTLLDTCFSGEASRRGEKALAIEGIGVDERTAKLFLSGEGTFVITSSRPNERSWESERIQNSYFTYYLIEAFRRAKEPPTVKEVFDYISTKVPDAVAREKQAPQHPQIQPSTGPGDLRIGVIPRNAATDRRLNR